MKMNMFSRLLCLLAFLLHNAVASPLAGPEHYIGDESEFSPNTLHNLEARAFTTPIVKTLKLPEVCRYGRSSVRKLYFRGWWQ